MTLSDMQAEIDDLLGYDIYPGISTLINDAIEMVAGGVRLPDGRITPPLPDLLQTDTVSTTNTYVTDLPNDYQRNLFLVSRSNGVRVPPPDGGDYYSFAKFIYSLSKKTFDLRGTPYLAVVKGRKLYYQAIPTNPEQLTIMYYRVPVRAGSGGDDLDGMPDRFMRRIVRHYVSAYYRLQKGDEKGYERDMNEYIRGLVDLADFYDVDEHPKFYGEGEFVDLGVCD